MLTGVLGLGDDLAKELGEVWKVVAEELGLQHKRFTGVVGSQLTAQKLGLSLDAERGSLLRVLFR
jgi:hypothetical protein